MSTAHELETRACRADEHAAQLRRLGMTEAAARMERQAWELDQRADRARERERMTERGW